jgi:hypothetical protein
MSWVLCHFIGEYFSVNNKGLSAINENDTKQKLSADTDWGHCRRGHKYYYYRAVTQPTLLHNYPISM